MRAKPTPTPWAFRIVQPSCGALLATVACCLTWMACFRVAPSSAPPPPAPSGPSGEDSATSQPPPATDANQPVDRAATTPDRRPTGVQPPRRRALPRSVTAKVSVRFAPVRTRCGGRAPRPEELRHVPVTQTRLTIERARPITRGRHKWSQYAVVTTDKRGTFSTTFSQGWAYRATRTTMPNGSHRSSCIFAYRRINPRARCIFRSTYIRRCSRRGPGIPGRP